MSLIQSAIRVEDESQIGEARREANKIADIVGFNELLRSRAAIIATELAANLIKHAGGGELHIQAVTDNNLDSMSVLSVDRGEGIKNIDLSLTDGYSTAGTAGNGLGAVKRLSSEFDIYSNDSKGTVVFSRLNQADTRVPTNDFDWGAITRPLASESVCGDSWRIAKSADQIVIMVVDGLGHGIEAANAAAAATSTFDDAPHVPLRSMVEGAHGRMRGTRGAALAVAQIHLRSSKIKYVGVGNISGCIRTIGNETNRGLFTHNGTVGVQVRKIQEFDYEFSGNGVLVMHSDGLQTRWNFDSHPGLLQRHPAVIAGILYRDYSRGRDDASVVVVRLPQAKSDVE